MSRFVSSGIALALALFVPALHAQEPKGPGSATWAKDYPKVANGVIEVQGSVSANPGFKFVEIELYVSPIAGGLHTSVGTLKTQDGKWGDIKDGKIVAKRIDLEKGKWSIWAKARYTPEGTTRVIEYYTMIETVEIK